VPVSIPLLPTDQAPGYRESLSARSEFRVQDVSPGWVAVRPGEGEGITRNYFRAHRLCDASTTITPQTWEPLTENPAWDDPDVDRRQRLAEEAVRLTEEAQQRDPEDAPPLEFTAFQGMLSAVGNEDINGFLESQVPGLFETFPEGSLWLVTVDPVLLARLAFLRSRITFDLIPDLHLDPEEFVGLRILGGHSITSGVSFADVIDPALLVFSPWTIGFAFHWDPHTLVLLFGGGGELRVKPPRSFAELYVPGILTTLAEDPWDDPEFRDGLQASDTELVLPWWLTRLNTLYSYATDPTRFADRWGRHDPARQFAWFLTFERLLADLTLILADPQAPELSRQQASFDLLDKAEALLGYTRSRSGQGFERFLRRSAMIERLDEAWELMPISLRPRFRNYTRTLFNSTYEDIRNGTLSYRLTPKGVRVARDEPDRLVAIGMESYVPELIRAVRNSSHGFMDLLTRADRFLLATNTGALPDQFPMLAALIGFGLLTDAEALRDQSWW
jgi:hypothetical protein